MKVLKLGLTMVLALGLVSSLQAKVLYQDDFSNWRDETNNPGFNAKIKADSSSKSAVVTTSPENTYGKVMSPEGGISVDINENTEITFELMGDIPKGDVKFNLMTAADPYDSHEVIPAQSKKGVYKAKLAEKTPWSGNHKFWVELWLEGADRTAKIANLKITDGQEEVVETKPAATKKKVRKKKQ